MYPFIEIFPGVVVYIFGVFLIISFFAFFWMLDKLWARYNFDSSMFKKNIFWYILSVLIFSRIFYVLSNWNYLKYIDDIKEFFIMPDYNLSLFGAMFWFLLILFINLKLRKEKLLKYIDGIVLSFLFMLVIAFIWALLWWQVYWKETNFWFEIFYKNSFTTVPIQWPIFPLAIFYSLLFFIEFVVLYILSIFIKFRWFIWYIWLIVFWIIVLILEFFSWKQLDSILSFVLNLEILSFMNFNINQIYAIIIIIVSFYRLYIISKLSSIDTSVSIENNT